MDKNSANITFLDNLNLKALLNNFLKNEANYNDEYVKVASAALKREGFEGIVLFTHKNQLVMINTNAGISKIRSGIVLDENGKIARFETSDDYKSVTTNALTRCLIMESINDETDIIRLKALTKDMCSWVVHYITNEINEKSGVPHDKWFPKFICNAHTHGLAAFNHRDFQLVLDIGPDSTAFLLNALAERVRDGEVFTDGELVDGVYPECKIKLAIARDAHRDVFRVFIPDEQNRYPGDKDCEYPYSEQDRMLE